MINGEEESDVFEEQQTLVHFDLAEDLYQMLLSEFENGVKIGALQHKKMMTELLEKHFLTDLEIKMHHEEYLAIILDAFHVSFSQIDLQNTAHPNVQEAYREKFAALRTIIEGQFMLYVRKHEIFLEGLSRKAKECALVAECLYEQLVEEGLSSGKIDAENFGQFHQKFYEQALQEFDKVMTQNGFESAQPWQCAMEAELTARFQDYQSRMVEEVIDPKEQLPDPCDNDHKDDSNSSENVPDVHEIVPDVPEIVPDKLDEVMDPPEEEEVADRPEVISDLHKNVSDPLENVPAKSENVSEVIEIVPIESEKSHESLESSTDESEKPPPLPVKKSRGFVMETCIDTIFAEPQTINTKDEPPEISDPPVDPVTIIPDDLPDLVVTSSVPTEIDPAAQENVMEVNVVSMDSEIEEKKPTPVSIEVVPAVQNGLPLIGNSVPVAVEPPPSEENKCESEKPYNSLVKEPETTNQSKPIKKRGGGGRSFFARMREMVARIFRPKNRKQLT